LFVFLSFSGGAHFLVLSRFLQLACLFYITPPETRKTAPGMARAGASLRQAAAAKKQENRPPKKKSKGKGNVSYRPSFWGIGRELAGQKRSS
jgi:hypothetical protein